MAMRIELAPFACHPAHSRGREFPEDGRVVRGPRDAFQRDRDRIIHSVAFRRLRHKTQVFIAPDGDHYRVRLTHSLEVAQIGRTIARALGLNEDLTEALCLAHDIGHPPFGHAGEDALQSAMADFGGFDHNGHALRVLMRLEKPYPAFDGLNLSWEMLEGMAKHNGPIIDPKWALAELDTDFPLNLGSHASLEAQVAAIADDIAYDNHDIDDGLRAGILQIDDVLTLPAMAGIWAQISARYPHAAPERLARELVRENIGVMVGDVIAETRAQIAASAVHHVDDVRSAGHSLCQFSPDMAAQERTLKSFLYERLYHHREQKAAASAARHIVRQLCSIFMADSSGMTGNWGRDMPADPTGRARHVSDYIAGMTDRFAIRLYQSLCGDDVHSQLLISGGV
jgi:dGTPase